MINTCKLNPCCGNMRDCYPPRQPDGKWWDGERWRGPEAKHEQAQVDAAKAETR